MSGYSEDEAKTKWCPFTFVREGGPWTCTGSNCMAWQWSAWVLKNPPTKWLERPMGRPDFDYAKPTLGFCGLMRNP